MNKIITLERLAQLGTDHTYLRNFIRMFIRNCPTCQLNTSHHQTDTISSKYVRSSAYPFQRINIDYIGPFPSSENGNTYTITIIDTFSRWIELIPTKTCDSKSVALALINYIGRYGIPSILQSDRGSHFVNDTITQLTAIFKIQHELSIAYSKQENSIVERANREINRHLQNIMFDVNITNQWEYYLPLVQRIINAKPHETLSVAPSNIIFGENVNLDRNLIPTESLMDIELNFDDFMQSLITKQKAIIEIAQNKIDIHNEQHLSQNSNRETTIFEIGSYVKLIYPNDIRPTRIDMKYSGPFQIISRDGDEYNIMNLVTFKTVNVHNSRLIKYNYATEHPRLIANKNNQVFDIKTITAHRGNINKNSTLEFYVQYEIDDSWEWNNWKNLRSNIKLHEYLKNNNLQRLIPKQFK